MMNLQQMMQGGATPGKDTPMVDNSETVYISSLALLKMLKHGKKNKEEKKDKHVILISPFKQEEQVFLWKLWDLCLVNL